MSESNLPHSTSRSNPGHTDSSSTSANSSSTSRQSPDGHKGPVVTVYGSFDEDPGELIAFPTLGELVDARNPEFGTSR